MNSEKLFEILDPFRWHGEMVAAEVAQLCPKVSIATVYTHLAWAMARGYLEAGGIKKVGKRGPGAGAFRLTAKGKKYLETGGFK